MPLFRPNASLVGMDHHPDVSRRALVQRLEGLQAAGLTVLPRKAPTSLDDPSPGVEPNAAPEVVRTAVANVPATCAKPVVQRETASPPSPDTSAPSLEVLREEVAQCTACEELARTRRQTVFGVGDPNARLCFMGEAPGADEDRLGEPFVGRAGQLLTKMIEACTLRRDEVYILNVLKCRPPGNRNPAPGESAACRGFLLRQLELIDPEYVCCLGTVAAQNFLEVGTSIGRLRGRVHQHASRKVVCTYHPAYLLRNPSAKKLAWEDLQMLMGEMGVAL